MSFTFQEFSRVQEIAASVQQLETKDDPSYGVLAQFFNPGEPIWSSRDTRTFISNGYRRNGTVYTCINKIAGAMSGIKWKLWTDRTMSREITSHPLLDLWHKPNPKQGQGSFIQQLAGFWHLSGNAYIYANRVSEKAPPDELWVLRSDMMKIVAGTGDIDGYVFGWGTSKARDFDPEEILHIKFPAFDDDFYGLSPVEVAMQLIDQQNEGNAWNTALMQNAGKSAGILFSKGYLTVEQRTQVRKELLSRYSGKRNAGLPLVLEADMTWQAMSMAPYELDWIQSREMNTREIAAIFDVAPELVGDSSGKTFANQHEAKQALYTENALPKLDIVEDHTNGWLVPMYPDLCDSSGNPVAYLAYDRKDIEALADLFAAQAKAKSDYATNLYNTGQCDLYTAQLMQEGVQADKNGKGIYKVGAILIRSQDLQAYAEQAMKQPSAPPTPTPENAPPTPTTTVTEVPPDKLPAPKPAKSIALPSSLEEFDAVARDFLIEQYVSKKFSMSDDDPRFPLIVQLFKLVLDKKEALHASRVTPHKANGASRLRSHSRPDVVVSNGVVSIKALDLETAEQKTAYFNQMEDLRAKWTDESNERLQSYFQTERKAIVAAIKSGDHAATVGPEMATALDSQQDDLKDVLVKLYQDVGQDVGDEVGKAFANASKNMRKPIRGRKSYVDVFNQTTIDYLLSLAGLKVKQINATTLAQLQAELAEGVADGESIPELAARIDNLYLDQIIPNRSETIARTETLSASNWGAMQAAAQSGLTLNKVWLATNDARTRQDHADADGQEVGMDEPFDVGGSQMMQPGDGSMGAPAGEICNCRCTVYFKRVQDDSEDTSKALIVAPREYKSVREFMEAVM